MNDEELIAKLKATAPEAPEDPALWASIEAGVREGIARPAPRAIRWRGVGVGLGLAAAAAALALFLQVRGHHHVAQQHHPRSVDDTVLLPDEDPTELVGDLDPDELQTVENHFRGGV